MTASSDLDVLLHPISGLLRAVRIDRRCLGTVDQVRWPLDEMSEARNVLCTLYEIKMCLEGYEDISREENTLRYG